MSGRYSLKVFLARKIQNLPLWLLQIFELPFVVKYSILSKPTPAIFILALPRSGSTVTYQTICHGLKVNYLSNLWNTFYQLPLIGGWLSFKKTQTHRSNFKSHQGFVDGFNGPAEGLRFWQWWLDCGLTDLDCFTLTSKKLKNRISDFAMGIN